MVAPVVFVAFDPVLAPVALKLELLTVPDVFVVLLVEKFPVLFEPELLTLWLVDALRPPPVVYWLVLPVLRVV